MPMAPEPKSVFPEIQVRSRLKDEPHCSDLRFGFSPVCVTYRPTMSVMAILSTVTWRRARFIDPPRQCGVFLATVDTLRLKSGRNAVRVALSDGEALSWPYLKPKA